MLPRCPLCRSTLAHSQIDFSQPFRCPFCGEEIYVPNSYPLSYVLFSVLVTGPLLFALGLRGYALLFATLVAWLPVLAGMMIMIRPLVPPPLRPYRPRGLTLDFRDKQHR